MMMYPGVLTREAPIPENMCFYSGLFGMNYNILAKKLELGHILIFGQVTINT